MKNDDCLDWIRHTLSQLKYEHILVRYVSSRHLTRAIEMCIIKYKVVFDVFQLKCEYFWAVERVAVAYVFLVIFGVLSIWDSKIDFQLKKHCLVVFSLQYKYSFIFFLLGVWHASARFIAVFQAILLDLKNGL